MGIIQCEVHGLNEIAQVCVHVKDARLADRFERALIVRDGVGMPVILCEACSATVTEPLGDEGLGEDGPHATCADCLVSWYERTGQGSLLRAMGLVGGPGP